jgi:hypothetical protein
MMKPADPGKCDDRSDFSGFYRPLFRSVLF